ncbi:MAG: hypothetical protein IT349_02890, partial [Candidatus Eisenbacteria bacterium]|nr:hypothetical protein [Candidatus Eisenbacteria bacterium]
MDRTGTYDQITMRGAQEDQSIQHADQPSLPLVVKWFVLPRDRAIESVDISVDDESPIDGEYQPVPVPREQGADEHGDGGDRLPDDPPWDPSRVYPETQIRVSNEGTMRGYRLATVAIWPVKYDAARRSLSIATRMSVTIRLRPRTADEQREDILCRRPGTNDGPYGEIRAAIASTVQNPEILEQFYPRV